MLMASPVQSHAGFELTGCYPELAGKRVLLTGLSALAGLDVARSFAEQRARLLLQFNRFDEASTAMIELVAREAIDLEVDTAERTRTDEVLEYARTAAANFGGVDVVINFVHLTDGARDALTADETEQRIADLLRKPCLIGKVIANRMRMLCMQGLVLNVAVLPKSPTVADRAFASVARAALTTMTRSEADTWAPHGIRFNAIVPDVTDLFGAKLAGEGDVAALALNLASCAGQSLTGHIFEAGPAWHR